MFVRHPVASRIGQGTHTQGKEARRGAPLLTARRALSEMAHGQEDIPRRYPGPTFDDEALAEDLLASERDGKVHVPTFARRTLARLQKVGLLHTPDDEPLVNARRVQWDKEGKVQDLWIRFDTHRTHAGYMAVEVVDAPRSDPAILAAMTALISQPVDFEQFLEAKRFLHSQDYKVRQKKIEDTHRKISEGQAVSSSEFEEYFRLLLEDWAMKERQEPLRYILPLIRYYKPEAAHYSKEEYSELLKQTCSYVADFLESLRRLQAFLEYGTPNRNLRPVIQKPKRDVRAAVLHDVEGLTYLEIGRRMKLPDPPDLEIKGENQTVRKMVNRGREILEKAFGEEGWQERVESMKAEKASWRSLSKEEQDRETDVEMEALLRGISIEEARRRSERRR